MLFFNLECTPLPPTGFAQFSTSLITSSLDPLWPSSVHSLGGYLCEMLYWSFIRLPTAAPDFLQGIAKAVFPGTLSPFTFCLL